MSSEGRESIFPLTEAESRVEKILNLEEISIQVERGTNLGLDKILQTLEKTLFDSAGEPKKENLDDEKIREMSVHVIEKIRDSLDDLETAYAAGIFTDKAPAGVKTKDKNEFNTAVEVLRNLLFTYVDKIKNFLNEADRGRLGVGKRLEKDPDIGTMTLEQIVDEISRTIQINALRAVDLNNRYLQLIGEVKDIKTRAWYKTKRVLQFILAKGDTGIDSFDVWFNAIMEEVADKAAGFLQLARALFMKRPTRPGSEGPITAEEMDETEIDMRAIEVYEYIVQRIKHEPEYGGLNYDPEDINGSRNEDPDGNDPEKIVNYSKENFSYNILTDDRVAEFEKHLKAKFSDIESRQPGLLDQLIKYTQAMAGKSHGFIPHLLRETTRSHGLSLASLRSQDFKDELFVAAPFAAGHYSRNRYGDNIPNSTSEELLFIPEKLLAPISKPAKQKTAKELWEIVNLFRETLWGEIPEWVMETRKMIVVGEFDITDPSNPIKRVINYEGKIVPREVMPGEIDLNDSVFPLPGEVVINILKVENEKRELVKRQKNEFEKLRSEEQELKSQKEKLNLDLGKTKDRIAEIDVELLLVEVVENDDKKQVLDLERNELLEKLERINQEIALLEEQLGQFIQRFSDLKERQNEEIKKFAVTYGKLGYGYDVEKDAGKLIEGFNRTGIQMLTQVKPDHYIPLAFEALKNMYGAFREKPSVLSKDEIIEKFIYWQDKLIGKAKLVPGKHHLLFGPFTVRYIYRLLSQYENRRNQDLVNELRLELLKHLEGAGGLPGHVKEFVRRHIANKKAVSTLTRYVRSISEGNYHKKLWNFQNEHPSGLERKIASELPFGWGKTAEGGGPVETVAPWNWDELDEDTG